MGCTSHEQPGMGRGPCPNLRAAGAIAKQDLALHGTTLRGGRWRTHDGGDLAAVHPVQVLRRHHQQEQAQAQRVVHGDLQPSERTMQHHAAAGSIGATVHLRWQNRKQSDHDAVERRASS